MKLLLTGGTGFIGRYVVEALAPQVSILYLLIRPQSLERAKKMFSQYPNIRFILGDVFSGDVCYQAHNLQELMDEVTSIVHLAARYDLEMSVYDAYTNNVIGVQNMLTLARRMKKLEYFHHISSYSVNAYLKGEAQENDLNLKAFYNDHYAKSKMQAEYMVRTMNLGKVKKRIYRPGIVVGHSQTGHIDKVDGPYYFLRILEKLKKTPLARLKVFPLPYGPQTLFPIIPVDTFVSWIAEAVLKPNPNKDIEGYHFLPERPISMDVFVKKCLEALSFDSKLIRLKRVKSYAFFLPLLEVPKELLFYMFSDASYSVKNRKHDFPHLKEIDMNDCVATLVAGSHEYFQKEGSQ
jgi:thioester reductase-like protein